MVPHQPEDVKEDVSSESEVENDSDSTTSNSSNQPNQAPHPEEMEQEYHTEDSEPSSSADSDDSASAVQDAGEQSDSVSEDEQTDPTLLPANLLQPLPSPAHSSAVGLLWNQMNRKQKQAERMRSRKAKKRIWDKLKEDAKGTGVLEAARVAQLRRGVGQLRDKVMTGRVEKASKPQVSGRQALIEERKRQLERHGAVLEKPSKKTRSRPNR